MQALLFIGIQASGKSTFYRQNYADTHLRINLDMLKTRHREQQLFECCLAMRQPFVIDNTNLSRADRQRYIPQILEHGFTLHGLFFSSSLEAALARNTLRGEQGGRNVPKKGVLAACKRLEHPSFNEGFTALSFVTLTKEGFQVSPWEERNG